MRIIALAGEVTVDGTSDDAAVVECESRLDPLLRDVFNEFGLRSPRLNRSNHRALHWLINVAIFGRAASATTIRSPVRANTAPSY